MLGLAAEHFFQTKKETRKSGLFFCTLIGRSVTALFGFATFDFARFLIVSAVAQFFEGAFFVEFFLQPAQSTIDDLAFLYADFGIH